MLLPFGCCLQADVVHCVLDESGFSAVTVQPIVHAVEHALQILAVEFVHVPAERRQAAVNGVIHLLVRFVLDLRECGSPRIGRVDRVLLARLRVNGRFVEDAMLGMGAPPSARNFFNFSSVRLWMASSVPFFSTGSFAENLTTSDASATLLPEETSERITFGTCRRCDRSSWMFFPFLVYSTFPSRSRSEAYSELYASNTLLMLLYTPILPDTSILIGTITESPAFVCQSVHTTILLSFIC